MPPKVVWPDEIVNKRVAVLTPAEAYEFLKKVEIELAGDLPAAEHVSVRKVPIPTTLAEERQKVIELDLLQQKRDARREELEEDVELTAIRESQEKFGHYVEKGVLQSDGLPRWMLTAVFRAEMVKNRKTAEGSKKMGSSLFRRIDNMRNNEISAKDIQRIIEGSDDEEAVENGNGNSSGENFMDVDSVTPTINAKTVKTEMNSDTDTDDDMESPKDVKKVYALSNNRKFPEPTEPDESAVSFADNSAKFKAAFELARKRRRVIATFNATPDGGVEVNTMDGDQWEQLNEGGVTNLAFTDEAIRYGLGTEREKPRGDTPDEVLRLYHTGDIAPASEKLLGDSKILKTQKTDHRTTEKVTEFTDLDIIKDRDFRRKLSELNPTGEEVVEEFEGTTLEEWGIPTDRVLQSMWTEEERELNGFIDDVKKRNESFDRQRVRIQHLPVQVPKKALPPLLSPEESDRYEALLNNEGAFAKQRVTNVVFNGSGKRLLRDKKMECRLKVNRTLVSGCIEFLEAQKAAYRTVKDIDAAFKSLSTLPLTFLEKQNIINHAPDTLPGILCMLDDSGARFSKEHLALLEETCKNLYPNDPVMPMAMET